MSMYARCRASSVVEVAKCFLFGRGMAASLFLGTFTISNLGMFGVSSFVSILPPNQGAIMAVAASAPTAILQKNGMMGMVCAAPDPPSGRRGVAR